jgi:hypothetical protein
MRVPRITHFDTSVDKNTIEIGKVSFEPRFYDLGREKDKHKFITTVEHMVRNSLEYHELIAYLKESLGMTFCSFFHKISKEAFGKNRIRIEIHHEPFTLYDIVAIILLNRIENNESVDMFRIADEVMACHYEGIVGLLPLSVTVHQLVHSGKLFVPLQYIDPGFNEFYNRYKLTIQQMDGLQDMLEAKVRLSQEFAKDPEQFLSILKKKYIYVISSEYDAIPQKLEKVA